MTETGAAAVTSAPETMAVRELSDREREDARVAEALGSGHIPEPHPDAGKIRILWVFAWLVVGGEETEVRLLARTLDRTKYRIDVIPCFRREGMPDQSHEQLRALGVTQFAGYLQHDNKEETLRVYGETVIPALTEHATAKR